VDGDLAFRKRHISRINRDIGTRYLVNLHILSLAAFPGAIHALHLCCDVGSRESDKAGSCALLCLRLTDEH